MSQNRTGNETNSTTGNTGSTGTTGTGSSAGSTGTSGTTGTSGSSGASSTSLATSGGAATGAATATDRGIASKAKEYGQTVADAESQAKDYLADKASVVTDKIQDLRNVDYAQLANDAKDYARQNPGQALLVAAAAGFVIGLLVRGGRK